MFAHILIKVSAKCRKCKMHSTLCFVFEHVELKSCAVRSLLIAPTDLKIQVSGATADLLQILGGYVLTCRGSLNVKVRFPPGLHLKAH